VLRTHQKIDELNQHCLGAVSISMRTATIRVALREKSNEYVLSVKMGGVNEYADLAWLPTEKESLAFF
jgi:hypothetical protein